jgi:hypothetical protein
MQDKHFKQFDTQQEVETFIKESGVELSWLWDRGSKKYVTCEKSNYSYEESVENMATETYSRGGHYLNGGMYKRNNY